MLKNVRGVVWGEVYRLYSLIHTFVAILIGLSNYKLYAFSIPLQYKVRLKTVGYSLLYGKKAGLQLHSSWLGDELAQRDHNPNATHYTQIVSTF